MLRIGQGIDTHRYTGKPGKLLLGGELVSEEYGVESHSDGDVLLHALTDAVLGAIAGGDIGQLFPDSDQSNKGRSSIDFLLESYSLARAKGYRIVNVDTTVIAQQPKINKYKRLIAESIAEILDLQVNCVGVKAKTAEKMDAIGRCEGIGAFAVVLLQKEDKKYD